MNTRRWTLLAGAMIALIAMLVAGGAAAAEVNRRSNPGRGPANGDTPAMTQGGRMGGHAGDASLVAIAADKLGMTRAELATELQAGKSIAEVAQAQNVDPAVIVEAAVAARTEHLASLVDAGRLTQAQADQRLATMRANITTRINQTGLAQAHPNGAGFMDENGDDVCDNARSGAGGRMRGRGR